MTLTPPTSRSSSLAEIDGGRPLRTSRAVVIVDIRPREAYSKGHVHAALNIALSSAPDELYGDAQAVENRWHEMWESINGPLSLWPQRSNKKLLEVLVLCNNGDSGRMAVSILRAKGLEAFTIEGGYDALVAFGGYLS
jgi:rhodanese-related sulfurtransferase